MADETPAVPKCDGNYGGPLADRLRALRDQMTLAAEWEGQGFKPVKPGEIRGWVADLDALLTAAEGEGWQPIDTAPKDGTPFLVYWDMAPGDRHVEMVDDWETYLVTIDLVARPASGWHPLPAPPAAVEAPITSEPTGCCCRAHHRYGGRCVECPIHGMAPPPLAQDAV